MAKKPPQPLPDPYPTAPEHLSYRSKAIWAETGPERVKTPQRRTLFQAALESLDLADEARRAVLTDGLTSTTKSTGAVHVNPAAKVEIQARQQFARLWQMLGLSKVPVTSGLGRLLGSE